MEIGKARQQLLMTRLPLQFLEPGLVCDVAAAGESEGVLEQRGHSGALACRPREPFVDLCEGDGQSVDLEVSAQSVEDEVVVGSC